MSWGRTRPAGSAENVSCKVKLGCLRMEARFYTLNVTQWASVFSTQRRMQIFQSTHKSGRRWQISETAFIPCPAGLCHVQASKGRRPVVQNTVALLGMCQEHFQVHTSAGLAYPGKASWCECAPLSAPGQARSQKQRRLGIKPCETSYVFLPKS